jgi:type III secretory pathway component EscS
MKKTYDIFIWSAPCGLLATFLGLCTAYWANQARCPNLTLAFIWELVPVSAYVLLFIGSITYINILLNKHEETVYSFYGFMIWGGLAHGCVLLPVGLLIFPSERFFKVGATCNDYGSSYMAEVVAPFALAQSLMWLATVVGISLLRYKLQQYDLSARF